MQHRFFNDLSASYSVLKVSGTNAAKFLQGQLTCNLNYITNNVGIGAKCNLKGRVIALFNIFQHENDWYLITPIDVANKLQQDLAKYALFSKCKVEITDNLSLFGIVGQVADVKLDFPACLLHLPHNRFILLCFKEDAAHLSAILQKHYAKQDVNAWYLAQIRAGIAHISLLHSEKFIPQMLNLPAINAVSFKKGCYMGQEIIARLQYLGQSKKQLFYLSCTDDLTIGAQLFNADNKEIGEIILNAQSNKKNKNSEFLAVLEKQAATNPIYTANRVVAKILDLPYIIDKDAEILR